MHLRWALSRPTHGARPVHLIITTKKWSRSSRRVEGWEALAVGFVEADRVHVVFVFVIRIHLQSKFDSHQS